MTDRGIRNNNPGNIKHGAPWQGLATPSIDEKGFCVFTSAPYGIRAIARTLITYQDKRQAADGSKIDTVQEIIDRWAPPSENDTGSYANHVRQILGIERGTVLDVHKYEVMRALVVAIIRHENSNFEYPDAVVDKGLVLAGVEPPPKPSRTNKAVTVGGGATVISLAAQYADQAAPLMPILDRVMEYAPWVLGVVVIGALAVVAYARLDDRRRGLR